MKTDTVRYVDLDELKSMHVLAPRKLGAGLQKAYVAKVFNWHNGHVYLEVGPIKWGVNGTRKVDLTDCRDLAGRRIEVLRGKRVAP